MATVGVMVVSDAHVHMLVLRLMDVGMGVVSMYLLRHPIPHLLLHLLLHLRGEQCEVSNATKVGSASRVAHVGSC